MNAGKSKFFIDLPIGFLIRSRWPVSPAVLRIVVLLVGFPLVQAYSQPLAEGQSKFLGASTSGNIWPNMKSYWNQVTPGNDGKWESVEVTKGQYNFSNLDNIYNYAKSNSMLFKEHCLVWGNQQPSWIVTLDSATQRAAVRQWIDTMGHRYVSMSFVDVVNEPFHAVPSYANALGGNGATGWDWVITAFQWARQSCAPGVKLILNEYNVLHDNSVTTNYINLITLLKDRGLIYGIGIQGHYFEFRSRVGAPTNNYVYNVSIIKANLNRLGALGIPIYIAEFDIDEPNDATQLDQYKTYFPIFWDHPAVKGITFWGYIQNDVWTSFPETYLLHTDGSERPVVSWIRNYLLVGPPPEIPALVSPRSITDARRTPAFVWRSAAYAKKYRLQVSTGNEFSAVVCDTTITDTTFTSSVVLDPITMYFWRVCSINLAGTSQYSTTSFFSTGTVEGIRGLDHEIPDEFGLSQNYPNPFNPTTNINYQLRAARYVRLTVFDMLGKKVATLVEERQEAGSHSVVFNAQWLPGGIYFYRMMAGNVPFVRKLVLLK